MMFNYIFVIILITLSELGYLFLVFSNNLNNPGSLVIALSIFVTLSTNLIILIKALLEKIKEERLAAKKQNENVSKMCIETYCEYMVAKICFHYKTQLGTERFKTKRVDAYGNVSHDQWDEKEKLNFYEKVILRDLSEDRDYLESNLGFRDIILTEIDAYAAEAENEMYSRTPVSSEMSGESYEAYVAGLLSEMGFKVQLTKTTGDQGVDIIAKKSKVKIAIQCKRYSNRVGNAAVQEVVSGMKFYKADMGVVVTNNKFTKSAIELANVSGILLLHDSELGKLDKAIDNL